MCAVCIPLPTKNDRLFIHVDAVLPGALPGRRGNKYSSVYPGMAEDSSSGFLRERRWYRVIREDGISGADQGSVCMNGSVPSLVLRYVSAHCKLYSIKMPFCLYRERRRQLWMPRDVTFFCLTIYEGDEV